MGVEQKAAHSVLIGTCIDQPRYVLVYDVTSVDSLTAPGFIKLQRDDHRDHNHYTYVQVGELVYYEGDPVREDLVHAYQWMRGTRGNGGSVDNQTIDSNSILVYHAGRVEPLAQSRKAAA